MTNENRNKLLRWAFGLAIITIIYNVAEGVISIFFGVADDTLALLGFGVDSFVEVISGTGIAHMTWRMQRNPSIEQRDTFERRALRITGFSFYLLVLGLVAGAVINLLQQSQPETTMAGIVISSLSIATMYFLMKYKLRIGKALNSVPIIADANCTKTCFYLSIILLASSGLYELFRIGYIDVIGSLGIAWFAFREGREAFEKARNNSFCGCESSCSTD